MNVIEPLDVGDTVPARHDQSNGRAVITRQRITIHLIGNDNLVTHGIVNVHATPERLFDLDVTDRLHTFVHRIKDHLDTVALNTRPFEQILETNTAPLRITDQAVIKIMAIATAFKSGIDLDLLHALQFIERKFECLIDETCNPQRVVIHRHFGLSVMLNEIKLIVRGVKRVDISCVDEVHCTLHFRGDSIVFRDIRERHKGFALRQRKLGPERHTCSCGQTTQRNARFQDLAPAQLPRFTIVRHSKLPRYSFLLSGVAKDYWPRLLPRQMKSGNRYICRCSRRLPPSNRSR